MPFPLEAPQACSDYFLDMQGATPPDHKWAVGLEVARLWLEYCQKDDAQRDNRELISIIKTFMPFRYSGTGFLDLWTNMMGMIARLPVNRQYEVWLEIFNKSRGTINTT